MPQRHAQFADDISPARRPLERSGDFPIHVERVIARQQVAQKPFALCPRRKRREHGEEDRPTLAPVPRHHAKGVAKGRGDDQEARVHFGEVRPVWLVGRKKRLRARRHDKCSQMRELLCRPRRRQPVERGPVHGKQIRVVVAHPQMRHQALRVKPEMQVRRAQEPLPAALRRAQLALQAVQFGDVPRYAPGPRTGLVRRETDRQPPSAVPVSRQAVGAVLRRGRAEFAPYIDAHHRIRVGFQRLLAQFDDDLARRPRGRRLATGLGPRGAPEQRQQQHNREPHTTSVQSAEWRFGESWRSSGRQHLVGAGRFVGIRQPQPSREHQRAS